MIPAGSSLGRARVMARNFLGGKDTAVVAYGETKIERATGKTTYELAAAVAAEIFAKTGLEPKDIDGLLLGKSLSEAPNTFYCNFMADYLGITPRWSQVSDLGGASAIGNVARSALALQAGLCETALVIAADAPLTVNRSDYGCYRAEFWHPVGIQGPPGAFGLIMHRYMAQYDLDFRGLGALAVAQRKGAVKNDNAIERFRHDITIEDYLNSRIVSTPLRLLDAVMVCDGANGVLMMTTERARRLGYKKLVHPLAYAEIANFNGAAQTPDITETGFSVVGPEVLAKAGMTPADIQQFHPYDDFLIAVMLKLEQIGFCKRGEGSQFLRDTDLSPMGKLPINTGGGQIGAGQPGLAGGGLNLVEAVRQLMGEAGARQVPDPRNAMVTGIGVIPYGRNWCSSNALILAN
jgi:acetyl-CoA acetyltransferase